ncbi:hypothetical protein HDE_10003 [Halotydeus destructor]|nr:hypothetical protein HDE_10003 [Halotydeus destructor]
MLFVTSRFECTVGHRLPTGPDSQPGPTGGLEVSSEIPVDFRTVQKLSRSRRSYSLTGLLDTWSKKTYLAIPLYFRLPVMEFIILLGLIILALGIILHFVELKADFFEFRREELASKKEQLIQTGYAMYLKERAHMRRHHGRPTVRRRRPLRGHHGRPGAHQVAYLTPQEIYELQQHMTPETYGAMYANYGHQAPYSPGYYGPSVGRPGAGGPVSPMKAPPFNPRLPYPASYDSRPPMPVNMKVKSNSWPPLDAHSEPLIGPQDRPQIGLQDRPQIGPQDRPQIGPQDRPQIGPPYRPPDGPPVRPVSNVNSRPPMSPMHRPQPSGYSWPPPEAHSMPQIGPPSNRPPMNVNRRQPMPTFVHQMARQPVFRKPENAHYYGQQRARRGQGWPGRPNG